MVTFILAAGAIPEGFEPDAFFSLYLSGGKGYEPKWLQADGKIVPLPTSGIIAGAVLVGELLIFEDVPPTGKLAPMIHSQELGKAYVVAERLFTPDSPAKDNHLYTINFALQQVLEGCVDDGHAGETCPTCHGLGQVYGG